MNIYIKCHTFIKIKGTLNMERLVLLRWSYLHIDNSKKFNALAICPLFSTTSCTGTVSEICLHQYFLRPLELIIQTIQLVYQVITHLYHYLYIRILVANCLSPFFGRVFFMCTGTSYNNNILSYIYIEYQQQVGSDILGVPGSKQATEHHMFMTVATAVGQ